MRRSLGGFTLVVPILVVAGTLLGGCSSSGGGGGGGSGGGASDDGSARVAFVLQDGAVRDLHAFHVNIARLRLVDDHGQETDNLLAKSADLNLLGLRDGGRLLATASVPAGTYQAVTMVLAPDSVDLQQLDLSGADVEIASVPFNLPSRTFQVPIEADLRAQLAQVRYLLVDFDLEASLDGEIGVRPFEVVPTARARIMDASSRVAAAPFKGIVRSVGSDRFEVEAFYDADLKSSAGFVSVRLPAGALLLDAGLAKAGSRAAFLAGLSPDLTVVEVQGTLDGDGVLRATTAIVEDEEAPDWLATQVEASGAIVGREPGRYQLLVEEFTRSAEHAGNVLAGLGRPRVIPVTYDDSARFIVEGERIADRRALRIGQRVKVSFSFFAAFPFPADLFEILESTPGVRGTIVDLGSLPDSVGIEADPEQAAVIGGKVDAETITYVDLTAATIGLDVPAEPLLDPTMLAAGSHVLVHGELGDPGAPISATDLTVTPGRLTGDVLAIDRAAGRLDLRVLMRPEVFGVPEPDRLATALLLDETVYQGTAASRRALFDLVEGLSITQAVRLSVQGITSGAPGELLVYVVDSRVVDRQGGAQSIQLWPPDQGLVMIDLRRFLPNRPGDAVNGFGDMTVFSIMQDEAVDPTGNGTRPDAWILGDGVVLIRAERDKTLNGRVYEIKYAYPDHSSPSVLTVTVPIKEFLNPAINDGAIYDSTDTGS